MPSAPMQCLPSGPGYPHAPLPLAGITLLAVEDSRFASEALRLLCQRSGARMRRAETLAAARRHLAVYRPDVVLVDLGLPDGDGVDLIRSLARAGESLVLAISGDPDGWSAAMRAGAAGFLEKPLVSPAAFQSLLLGHLKGVAPDTRSGDRPIMPDRQALQDDLVHAAGLIAAGGGLKGQGATPRYVTDFVLGLARSSNDAGLAGAATRARSCADARAGLARMLVQRISRGKDPFAPVPRATV